jgi:putative transposase
VIAAFKYRLYLNVDQRIALAQHFGCVRWVYNWALAKKSTAWKDEKKTISRFDLSAELPKLKRAEGTEWLGEVTAQCLQQSLRCLDQAYQHFFKDGRGFPKFKRKDGCQSCQFPQGVKTDFEDDRLTFPHIGSVRAVFDRRFHGKIKTTTVSKTSTGKYFASITVDTGVDVPETEPYSMHSSVGVDLGLTHFATLSTGEKIDNPRLARKAKQALARAQRRLSRCKAGSKNRAKRKLRVARISERVVNQRQDFLHQLSTRLIRENQAICLETLSVENMKKNRCLAFSVSDVGWSTFVDLLKYKAIKYGKTILRIGRFEPSSKQCSCGVVNHELTLRDRTWTCRSCDVTHDRDVLAAQNIRRMAFDNLVGQDMPELNACRDSAIAGSMKQEVSNQTRYKSSSFVAAATGCGADGVMVMVGCWVCCSLCCF